MQRDRLLVAEMIDAAARVVELVGERSADDLHADNLRREAILWNLTVLGEASSKVSTALDVDREASSLLDAIASAITQAESVPGIQVMRVEGEELVSQADIAERTGRTRQAVNHWIKRDADSSRFPEPAYGTSTRSPLWRWADVQSWLEPDVDTDDRGRIIALANAALLTRRNLNDTDERRLVETLLAAS